MYAFLLTRSAPGIANNIRYATDIESFRETEVADDPLAAKNSAAHLAAHWIGVVMDALRAGVEDIRGLSPMYEYVDCGDFGSDSDPELLSVKMHIRRKD